MLFYEAKCLTFGEMDKSDIFDMTFFAMKSAKNAKRVIHSFIRMIINCKSVRKVKKSKSILSPLPTTVQGTTFTFRTLLLDQFKSRHREQVFQIDLFSILHALINIFPFKWSWAKRGNHNFFDSMRHVRFEALVADFC